MNTGSYELLFYGGILLSAVSLAVLAAGTVLFAEKKKKLGRK